MSEIDRLNDIIAHQDDELHMLKATVSRLEGENEELRNEIAKSHKSLTFTSNEADKLRTRLTVLERVRKAAEKACVCGCGNDFCTQCACRKVIKESLAAARGKEEGER